MAYRILWDLFKHHIVTIMIFSAIISVYAFDIKKPEKGFLVKKIGYMAVRNKSNKIELVDTKQAIALTKKEEDCLAKNIYWEAMHEPLMGQVAVAAATLTRVRSKKWGDDVCEIVYQKKQFSWTNYKHLVLKHPTGAKWLRAKRTVNMFKNGLKVSNFESVDHYYGDYIKPPKWSANMKVVAHIGKHIFLSSNE